MASNPENDNAKTSANSPGLTDPNQKTLNVWSKPIDEANANANTQPTISDAVSMIKTDDFRKVAETPCARNAFLTGIGTGFGAGGIRFVLGGNIGKATNLAAGFFVMGSMASYEYCQYLRRCEKRDMKRHIEVVHEGRREQARKIAETKMQQQQEEEQKKASRKPWYRFFY